MSLVAADHVTRAADSTCLPIPLPHSLRLQYTPQPQTDASIGCVPPLPCLAANPPSLSEWPTEPPQELKLTATSADAVSGYKYIEIWQQEWDSATSSWSAGTVIETSDAVERANTSSNTATYGLSGLKPGVRYGHRVAWCRLTGSVKTCNCFVDTPAFLDDDSDGTPDARPTTFPTPPLTVPSGLIARAEDRFERPQTDPKRARGTSNQPLGGDGLGPGTWEDDMGSQALNIGNGSHIEVDSNGASFAEIPWNAVLEYLVSTAPSSETHTLAEVEFQPLSTSAQPNGGSGSQCPGQVACNYRFSAVTRLVSSGGVKYYYNVQISYDPDWPGGGDTQAKVRVQRGMGMSRADVGTGFDVVGTAAYDTGTGLGCMIDGSAAAANATNTGGLRDNSRKMVRARVRDSFDNTPEIYATVAWNWNGSGYDRYCNFKRTDTSIESTHPLYLKSGGWGLIVQHYDARVEAFRSFSAAP